MPNIDFKSKIVGVSFDNDDGTSRQELIEDELDDLVQEGETVYLKLLREPHNQYDDKAVAVFSPSGGQLGYLSNQVVESVAPLMDEGIRVCASVVQITGGEGIDINQNQGVNIRIWSEE